MGDTVTLEQAIASGSKALIGLVHQGQMQWLEVKGQPGEEVEAVFQDVRVNDEPVKVKGQLPAAIPVGHIGVIGCDLSVSPEGIVKTKTYAWHQRPGQEPADMSAPVVSIVRPKRRVTFSDGTEATIE